ncbi:MAG TPA: radical SAM protein [Steroidobacteraceae bacterium]|nr:radical SAM protein [Steroidobacteraceae bacterium]
MRGALLINPTITSARTARFPLAVLSLATALEGRASCQIVDGNVDRNFVATALRSFESGPVDVVGVSVMGGPQLRTAIAVSKAIRERAPTTPIVWGGHFPTICPEAALREPYVDYAVRGQGEDTFTELFDALGREDELERVAHIAGLSWRRGAGAARGAGAVYGDAVVRGDGVVNRAGAVDDSEIVHNRERPFSKRSLGSRLPYERLENPRRYLTQTFLGKRTAGYQAALGCRFRCTFCGVASMFRGRMALPTAVRLEQDLRFLGDTLGADSINFYDHNFFDREVDMVPLLEVLAKLRLPWWCFARADALIDLSEPSWELVRKSRLRMAYIGAESPSDWLLHDIRKGTRSDQTLAAVEVCHRHGVIPELSFMLAPPQDPEGETERTFEFIRHIKRRYPRTEIMIYVYTPLPPRPGIADAPVARATKSLRDCAGNTVEFPRTADEWARPEWIDYWCHSDAPWVSERLRQRIRDFTTVLGCRFPTATDVRSPPWGRAALRALASWRYRFRRYDRPWELRFSRKLIRLWDPRVTGL